MGQTQSQSQHKQLMERLNQLNILQESNTLLRDENTRSTGKASELETQVSSLKDQLQPLELKMRNLSAINDSLEADRKAMEVEVSRWKARNETLMNKTKQVDISEYQKLQEDF